MIQFSAALSAALGAISVMRCAFILRPATVGLIAAAALLLMNSENFIDYKSFLIFGAAFILTWKFKINPILMIILAGIAGIVLYW